MGGRRFLQGRTFSVRALGVPGCDTTPPTFHHSGYRARNKHKLWPTTACPIRNAHINYKELFAIWWAVLLWLGRPPPARQRTLILHCDNDFAAAFAPLLRSERTH